MASVYISVLSTEEPRAARSCPGVRSGVGRCRLMASAARFSPRGRAGPSEASNRRKAVPMRRSKGAAPAARRGCRCVFTLSPETSSRLLLRSSWRLDRHFKIAISAALQTSGNLVSIRLRGRAIMRVTGEAADGCRSASPIDACDRTPAELLSSATRWKRHSRREKSLKLSLSKLAPKLGSLGKCFLQIVSMATAQGQVV